jgi:two-component system sensor histidine kinase EvgS
VIRVLLVEDVPDDATLLVRQLRLSGQELAWRRVETAIELRDALASERWDVVIADYTLPTLDAVEALKILHQTGIDLPFIIVSGSIGELAAVAAMKAGAHDFFLKSNLQRLASAIDREITEARMREEHRRAVRARDDFLAIAAHELNTPLTALALEVNSARSAVEASPPDMIRIKSRVQGISRQVFRLTALVSNLLDVSRITAGRLTLRLEPFDLRDAASSVIAWMIPLMQRAGSEFDLSYPNEPITGVWDRTRVESIISNLLANALKYGRGGRIKLDLESGGDARHRWAVVRVIDRGIGIDEGDRERIFERFERAVSGGGGLGLGLWVVRQIVEAHQGSITVESAPGEGSKFTVFLPLGP